MRCSCSGGFNSRIAHSCWASTDFALLQQENTALKKSCNAMQAEIARLQSELRVVCLSTSSSASVTPVPADAANAIGTCSMICRSPLVAGRLTAMLPIIDNLDDVQLCVCRSPQRSEMRPAGIPQLDLRCISPYNEDEDDEDEVRRLLRAVKYWS